MNQPATSPASLPAPPAGHRRLARPSLRLAAGLLVPLVFFVVVYLFFPFRETFEFDQDEGVEAMKAFLVARGYPMFSQVWSDQPPVFTYILAGAFRLLGANADIGRSVTLVFSALLLGAGFYFLRLAWGPWHALSGAILVILLPYYTQLSVSIMLALPALAFCALALLALGIWHRTHQWGWLVASALLLALGVFTKLYAAILAPVFLAGLLFSEQPWRQFPAWRRWLRPAWVWGLVFGGGAALFALVFVGPANIGAMLNLYWKATGLERYGGDTAALTINGHLRGSLPVVALAALGALIAVWRRNWLSFYLVGWSAAAYAMLASYQPVWYHHQHLVTFPAALLAGVAAAEGVRLLLGALREIFTQPGQPRKPAALAARLAIGVVAVAGLAGVLAAYSPNTLAPFQRPPYFITGAAHAPWPEQMFLVKMANHAPETHWVITNLPMYAFRSGLLVPPDLAVMSEKRFATGELTEGDVIAAVAAVRPEQVLIGRRQFPNLETYLEQDYKLLYERGKRLYYVRKDLKD